MRQTEEMNNLIGNIIKATQTGLSIEQLRGFVCQSSRYYVQSSTPSSVLLCDTTNKTYHTIRSIR